MGSSVKDAVRRFQNSHHQVRWHSPLNDSDSVKPPPTLRPTDSHSLFIVGTHQCLMR
mgnify:CR=1 FL=1